MYFGKLCEKEAKKRSFFLWFCDLFAQADSSIEFSMICSRAAASGKGEPMARFKAAPGLSGAKAENWVLTKSEKTNIIEKHEIAF